MCKETSTKVLVFKVTPRSWFKQEKTRKKWITFRDTFKNNFSISISTLTQKLSTKISQGFTMNQECCYVMVVWAHFVFPSVLSAWDSYSIAFAAIIGHGNSRKLKLSKTHRKIEKFIQKSIWIDSWVRKRIFLIELSPGEENLPPWKVKTF